MEKYIRLPSTNDRSLRAWNAADEHILKYLDEGDITIHHPTILHDRFGFLTSHLITSKPLTITYLQSQNDAIIVNASNNGVQKSQLKIQTILDYTLANGPVAIMKIPKSLDLFRLYLIQLSSSLPSDGLVIAGFMTRHFTKAMLDIAHEYFEIVEQTKAYKKSRLLILSGIKSIKNDQIQLLNTISFNEFSYRQYLGVFSANHIDYATQFLLDNLSIRNSEKRFLDIGCGNGVISKYLIDNHSWDESIMMDDSILATASTLLNIKKSSSTVAISHYDLSSFREEQFDLIITNPPFHFEYEVDPTIAQQLLQNSHSILSHNGRLIIVANKHLNYKSQLSKWYREVNIVNQNEKFIIYEAIK